MVLESKKGTETLKEIKKSRPLLSCNESQRGEVKPC